MVIVVPALPSGQKCNPPVIRRVIAGFETARTPQVGSRVDQPGDMEADRDPQKHAPKQPSET